MVRLPASASRRSSYDSVKRREMALHSTVLELFYSACSSCDVTYNYNNKIRHFIAL